MRALIKKEAEPGATFLQQFPEPEVTGNEVLIRVHSAAVCGTDVHLYHWDQSAVDFHPKVPLVMGHECAGTIVKIGPDVSRVQVGDRVALETHIPCGRCFQCRIGNAHNCMDLDLLGLRRDGAFADLVTVPETVCFPLSEDISFDEGSLFEPAGVAVYAFQRAEPKPGDSILIVGCGPIGLVAVQLGILSGAAQVFAVDVNPRRLEKARSLGAVGLYPPEDDVAEAIKATTDRRGGVDVAFELSGNPKVYQWIFDHIRHEGTLISVGHPGQPIQLDVAAHINKQAITFKGVFGRRIWDTWEVLEALVRSGRLDLKTLISHRLGLTDYETAFRVLSEDGIKVIFSLAS